MFDKLSQLKQTLGKLWRENWETRFSLRDKPRVQVIYLKNHKWAKENDGVEVERKLAEPLKLDGVVLEEAERPRSVNKFGGSFHISIPPGWLESIASESKVRLRWFLGENKECIVLISKPNSGGEIVEVENV